ncbi:MAG TPA: response regulator [Ktedonobacterales bacterium]|nr:response regulator [Ktedonobacterales bacterium]
MQIVHSAASDQTEADETPRVLIVDDDAAIRKMLVDVLSLEGFHTETARDGREALAVLEDGRKRIMLLDLMMPIMDGWEVCRHLAVRPALRQHLSIILMSAGEKLEQARDLQVEGYLAKPFDVDHLLECLNPFVTDAQS